jgi:hypothetical protein
VNTGAQGECRVRSYNISVGATFMVALASTANGLEIKRLEVFA